MINVRNEAQTILLIFSVKNSIQELINKEDVDDDECDLCIHPKKKHPEQKKLELLNNIRRHQKSVQLLFPQSVFQQLVKTIGGEMQCTQEAFSMLQENVEEKLARWGSAAVHLACEMKGSQVVCKKDFQVVKSLSQFNIKDLF